MLRQAGETGSKEPKLKEPPFRMDKLSATVLRLKTVLYVSGTHFPAPVKSQITTSRTDAL